MQSGGSRQFRDCCQVKAVRETQSEHVQAFLVKAASAMPSNIISAGGTDCLALISVPQDAGPRNAAMLNGAVSPESACRQSDLLIQGNG